MKILFKFGSIVTCREMQKRFISHFSKLIVHNVKAFETSPGLLGARKRGNNVAEGNVSLFAAPGNICCGSKICFPGFKNVSEFVQKRFASSVNVSSFALRGKISEINVSSFAGAFTGH